MAKKYKCPRCRSIRDKTETPKIKDQHGKWVCQDCIVGCNRRDFSEAKSGAWAVAYVCILFSMSLAAVCALVH